MWTRMPDCFVPRRQPNGQLAAVVTVGRVAAVGPTSQPSRSAPLTMTTSLGGSLGAGVTDSSSSSVAMSSVQASPSASWSMPWSAALLAHRGRRLDRRHPVDQRPAADSGAGEHHHRRVPRREQAVVQIQAGICVELVVRHRRLVDERPGLEHDDRPPRLGSFGRPTPPPAPEPPRPRPPRVPIGSSSAPWSNGSAYGRSAWARSSRAATPARTR